jgi:hypothetical protein
MEAIFGAAGVVGMVARAECCTKGLTVVRYDGAPTLHLLASGGSGRGRRAAAQAGFRIAAEEDVCGGSAAIAKRPGIDVVLIDAAGADPCALASILPVIEEAGRLGRTVVLHGAIPAGAIAEGSAARVIVASEGVGLLEALRAAAAVRPLRLHDVKNHDGPRLQQLSEEVGRIATILASLSEEEPGEIAGHDDHSGIDSAFVRAIIRVRRLRDHYFRSEMFADPAWDMLLDLFAARLERQRVAVSSLCIAAAVPATTALRWIKTMTDQHLFVRVADPQDGRRVFIELSDEAAAGLEAYLRAAQRISPLIA